MFTSITLLLSSSSLTMDFSSSLQELELFLTKEVTHVITDREECQNNKGGGFYPKTPQSVTNESCHNDSSNIFETTSRGGRPVSSICLISNVGLQILELHLLYICIFIYRKQGQMQCLKKPEKQQLLSQKICWNKHKIGKLLFGQLKKYVILS